MAPTDSRVNQLIVKLKARGHRLTPQRVAVIEALCTSDAHPSVDQIFASVRSRFPMTSLATVYKTISMAKEMGEVLELEFSQGGNRYDGKTPQPHPHVICNRCGKIQDPSGIEIEALTAKIIAETGFRIETHRLDFYGLCPQCQEIQPQPTNP